MATVETAVSRSRSRPGRPSLKPARIWLHSVPAHPTDSPFIAILLAIIDAALHDNEAEGLTAAQRIVAQQLRIDLARSGQLDDPRVLLSGSVADGMGLLIGRTQWVGKEEAVWQPGLVNLTERQARFVSWSIEGFSVRQMAQWMGTAKGGVTMMGKEEDIYHAIATGWAKLRKALAPYYPAFADALNGALVVKAS